MKFFSVLSLIFFVLIAFSSVQMKEIPCVACMRGGPEVCARPTKGGPDQTFENACLVQAMDCGFDEHRKEF